MVQTIIDVGQYDMLCRQRGLSVRQSGKWQPGELPVLSYCIGNMPDGGERVYYLYLEIDCGAMMYNQPLTPYEIHEGSPHDIADEFDRVVAGMFGRDVGLGSFQGWDCSQIQYAAEVEVYDADRTIALLREAGMKDEYIYAKLSSGAAISPSVTTLTIYKKADMLRYGAFDKKGATVTNELIKSSENVLFVSAYARKAQLSRLLHQPPEYIRPPFEFITRERARQLVISAYRRQLSNAPQPDARELLELEQLLTLAFA